MEFHSILFETIEKEPMEEKCDMPNFFVDLNLDQIVQELLINKEEYNLNNIFYQSLNDISTINYRLQVMKDLENTNVYDIMVTFSNDMKKVREYIDFSTSLHNQYQREKWHLDAVNLYCNALINLNKSLLLMDLKSQGLQLFNAWLTGYINSDNFKMLYNDTENLYKEFNSIKYSVQIEKDKVVVNLDDDDEDYCASINSTFESINEVAFNYQINFFTGLEMCSLETRILEIVKKMNIKTFNKLERYFATYTDFLNKTIKSFDREIQFYISYLDYIGKFKRKGLDFTYPNMSHTKRIDVMGGYDLALAYKLLKSSENIISNDFYLDNEERIFILTGPNQGGKTTFARAFGQILFLASIGCPVPCQKAELYLFNNIFTHFAVEENLCTNEGRLKEELSRLNQIMEKASTDSIIIINELFATTTSLDAYTMGKKVLDHFLELDCFCLYVTHIFELAQLSEKTISLVATVNSDKGAIRTYKILRKSADGRAYANSVVEKYKLTYSQIKERLKI